MYYVLLLTIGLLVYGYLKALKDGGTNSASHTPFQSMNKGNLTLVVDVSANLPFWAMTWTNYVPNMTCNHAEPTGNQRVTIGYIHVYPCIFIGVIKNGCEGTAAGTYHYAITKRIQSICFILKN